MGSKQAQWVPLPTNFYNNYHYTKLHVLSCTMHVQQGYEIQHNKKDIDVSKSKNCL
jgi:hypothetical protein